MTSDCVIVPRREVKVSKVVQSKISNWQHWQCHWQRPITLIVNVCDARLCVGRWSFGHPAATPYLYQPSGASQLFRWIIFSAPHIFGNFVFFPDISFLFSARPSTLSDVTYDDRLLSCCVLCSGQRTHSPKPQSLLISFQWTKVCWGIQKKGLFSTRLKFSKANSADDLQYDALIFLWGSHLAEVEKKWEARMPISWNGQRWKVKAIRKCFFENMLWKRGFDIQCTYG